MFNQINWKYMQENNEDFTVLYAVLPHFYDATYHIKILNDLDKNKYQLPIGYKWRKAQTCSSCSSQSMTIGRSISESKTKSQALQTAWSLSMTGSASTTVGFKPIGDVGLSLGLSTSTNSLERNTFTDSLNLGTSLSKTISCDSKNIYLYGFSITSWNGKTETIPTDYYYCSNKDITPICIPKIVGNEKNIGTTIYCIGDDAEDDFIKKGARGEVSEEGLKVDTQTKPAEMQKQTSGILIYNRLVKISTIAIDN